MGTDECVGHCEPDTRVAALERRLDAAHIEIERQAFELRRVEQLQSQFLAMASHELRTPLTAIGGFTATMLDRWGELDDPDKLQFLEIIDAQSRRLNRLVQNLLTLSNVESGRLQVEPQRIDVVRALEDVVRDTEAEGVELVVPPSAYAYADPGHLGQILCNLVSNACRHGRPPVEVEVQVNERADRVEIGVRDHGDGVPVEFVPQLFQTFARARRNQPSADGTGLGLSIARALVEAQGGEVWYETNLPHGARFRVTLPRG